jgi:hypothetical protein
MNKQLLITELRGAIEDMAPLAAETGPNTRTWNGNDWVPAEPKVADPRALVWVAAFSIIVELVEAQTTPLSREQIAVIRRNLFGGMGSFGDVRFTPKTAGPTASDVNAKLDERRAKIYAALKEGDG